MTALFGGRGIQKDTYAMSTSLAPLSLSPDDAATLLGVNKRTVYRLIVGKKLVARKLGARTLVDYPILKAYHEGLPKMVSGAPIPNAPQRRRRGKARA
jgi:excisionase family DNA binding protein